MLGSAGFQFIEDRTDPAFSFPVDVEEPQTTEPVSLSVGGLNLLEVLSSVGRFATPPSGKAKFRLNVEPDRVYQAQAQSVELRVYENVHDTKRQSFLGGVLCVSAPLLLLIALALILYGPFLLTTRAKKRIRG
jgi:hypothetical protein